MLGTVRMRKKMTGYRVEGWRQLRRKVVGECLAFAAKHLRK